jgi:polysaccharide deacetylase family protein (PEP-CTERM system associated)
LSRTIAGTQRAECGTGIVHHFTVDVEEYFHVSAFEGVVAPDRWERRETRIRRSMDGLLSLLAEHEAKGTFFVLGWIAQRHPEVVRAIVDGGHEVASHGSMHRRVTTLSPGELRACVRDSRRALEDLTGRAVLGYRAPSFSIVPGREWALDVLIEEGYVYDSSLFPVRRRGYGYPGGARDPHWIARPGGRLAEFPPTTLRRAGINLPAAGGAYFRLFPLGVLQAALRECEDRGVPGTFYIHPWELDAAQPRLEVRWTTKIRHYGGLARTVPRLRRILSEFRFDSIEQTLPTMAIPCAAG